MTPATKLLIVTLLRLGKGAIGAIELWYCQETGQKVPSHWATQREIGLQVAAATNGDAARQQDAPRT